MGYQWGKSPLGAAGWKSRALAAEERVGEYRAEIARLQTAVGDARTERNTARHDVEKAHQFAVDAIKRAAGKMGRFRDRSERNAARVRMLAGDLRDAREALDDARGWTRQQWLTVVHLRGRLEVRADRVEALARRAREYRTESRMLRDDLAWEREVSRTNIQQLERALASAQSRAVEAEEKSAAPAPPAPDAVVWETRVKDLEGALRDQQSITEGWKREAGDARRAVTMLRSALTTVRFNAAHTKSEAERVLEQTEGIDYREMRKG